jgi:hypothetical protein
MVLVRRRPPRLSRLAIFAAVVTALASLATGGCDKKNESAPIDAGAPKRDAMEIPEAAAGVVSARPGCHAVVQGGARVDGMQEPSAVSVAVVKGKALVVNTIFKEAPAGAADAVETASASRVQLSATTGALESKPDLVTEPHPKDEPAGTALTWAVATPFGDELSTLSLGTTRSGAQGCGGGTVMVKGAGAAKALAAGHCHFSTALAGAARGDVAIAVTDGIVDPAKGNVPAVDAIVFSAGKSKPVRIESFAVPGTAAAERPKVDAPTAAASAAMTAAAYRVTRGGAQELHVVKLAPDGTKVGKVEIIDRGVIGTPALAFEGDTLHIVWATRATDKDPYALHWTKWPASGAPQPHQKLGTGVLSAYSPALAIEHGRFLLAWTEGEKTGVVKVGASTSGLTGALALAGVVSSEGVDAKSPRVALDQGAMFIVWQEIAGGASTLRASPVRCQE